MFPFMGMGGKKEFYPFPIDYSIKLDSALSQFLSRTVGSPDSALKWTFSTWVKHPVVDTAGPLLSGWQSADNNSYLVLGASNELIFITWHTGAVDGNVRPSNLLRDTAQWYHFFFVYDSANSTSADRAKFWINGVQYAHSNANPINVNTGCRINQSGYLNYLCRNRTTGDYGDLYMAETHLLDGIIGDINDFGEFIGNTWVPKKYTGDYGSQGWHLDFADPLDLGKDVSGNGNDWTASNGPEQTQDTPTNNFPTLDSLQKSAVTVSEAGLRATSAVSEWQTVPVNFVLPSTGKWQMEVKWVSGSVNYLAAGIVGGDGNWLSYLGDTGNGIGYHSDGRIIWDAATQVSSLTAWSNGSTTLGMVYDADLDTIQFYVNGTLQGTSYDVGACVDYAQRVFAVSPYQLSGGSSMRINNGADGFDYPISGTLPICTTNFPTPEIIDSDKGLWIPTWEGNASERNITGCPFILNSTDALVWSKSRDAVGSNSLFNTVRGLSAAVFSNSTSEELDPNLYGYLEAFSNGFTLKQGATNWASVNTSGVDYVAWVLNMRSRYGMDIVTYKGNGVNGRTVTHGLGAEAELLAIKNLSTGITWIVGCEYTHATAPWEYYLRLDEPNAAVLNSTPFNDTAPTASTFTVGTSTGTNTDGDDYVCMLFRSVPGFLKVGYWDGNGSTDGPRINNDVRTRYLLVKNVSASANWWVMDSERNPYNSDDCNYLYPNLTNVENSAVGIDFLSNGFKIRSSGTWVNASGNRYIYLAIGDAFPYVNAF